MALSGTFYTNVGEYWRIQGEWSATQNEGANTSTVTLRTYWMAVRSGVGAVYSSTSKSGFTRIEGDTENFTATAGLSAGQKKLIGDNVHTITHNSDGTFPDLDLTVSFSPQVTLSGTYYGTVSASASYALNTIPRESTLASSPSWTAGNNTTISISRFSSSFRHEVDIYAKSTSGSWVLIKQRDLSSTQTSTSSAFSTDEVTTQFTLLAGRSSCETRMVVDTYSGNTFIGSTSREGLLYAPAASHPTTGYDAYQYTDEEIDIPITRANSAFTHTVRYKLGTYTKTLEGVTTEASWTPTLDEQASLHAQMPNDTYKSGSVEVDTFYNGVKVRDTQSRLLQFYVRDADPVFSGSITYSDTNSAVTAVTGNNQYIVQGQSTLSVTLSAASVTAQKGATMSGFLFTVAGESQTVPYTTSAITRSFGTIDATTNQTIIVEAIDSRGNKSAVSKIVNVVPYSTPTIAPTAARINGFEADTKLNASGSFSGIKVAGVVKNSLTSLRYRTRLKNGTYGSYVALQILPQATLYSALETTVQFDITEAYDVEFSVIDMLGTTTVVKSVGVGRPIFFIDDVLGSIAMNDFPVDPGTFLVNGRLSFAGNIYASSGEGAIGGAIDMNNGDIVRANGIYFGDPAGNSGEGLLFIKSGAPLYSSNPDDYDNFYMRDGQAFINNGYFMRFVNTDVTGNGLVLGAGGQTIIGAGESAYTVADNTPFTMGQEYMHIASDENIYFHTDLQNGYAGRMQFTFDQNGIFYRPRYKEGNGFNVTTSRVAGTSDAPLLIQDFLGDVAIPANTYQAFADFTFPVAFDVAPQWVIVAGRDSNSANANFGVYNITTTGCRVYASRVTASQVSMVPNFQLVACGRKA